MSWQRLLGLFHLLLWLVVAGGLWYSPTHGAANRFVSRMEGFG